MTPVIQLEGVGKRYWKLEEQAMLLKSLLPGRRTEKKELWALRGVDLSVEPGETVGILGHNGAGKTTLLRLLAGVSRPTVGQVTITGRVAPLISVGVGFHQEMTGRENVLVNGMLLGLTRRQVEQRFDQIVDFAELEEFIDTPVKFYSSGMYMRLGFAVAVHVDPQVMLVDEVLAVGDIAFQLKCLDRMRQLQGQGATILFVSHSMPAIRLLCPRAVLVRKGRVEFDGPTEQAIAHHHALMSAGLMSAGHPTAGNTEGDSLASPVEIVSRQLESGGGSAHHPEPGDWLAYRVGLRFNRPVDSPHFEFRVTSQEGVVAYEMRTAIDRDWRRFEAGDTTEIDIPFCARLGGGTFYLTVSVFDRFGRQLLATDPIGTAMFLSPRLGSGGLADLEATINAGDERLSDQKPLLIVGHRDASDVPDD